MTLSQDLLKLMTETAEADVTLLVGNEKIKAHKGHFIARSTYFRSWFGSGWTESLTNEVQLDEDPLIFKEALKFMYSGLAPENLDDVAIELLPLADVHGLDELKQLCDSAIRRILSVENIAQVLRIADDHDCDDLFKYCVPFFKANAQDLNWSGYKVFSKALLVKLLRACSN